jgi:hypothetical protein
MLDSRPFLARLSGHDANSLLLCLPTVYSCQCLHYNRTDGKPALKGASPGLGTDPRDLVSRVRKVER